MVRRLENLRFFSTTKNPTEKIGVARALFPLFSTQGRTQIQQRSALTTGSARSRFSVAARFEIRKNDPFPRQNHLTHSNSLPLQRAIALSTPPPRPFAQPLPRLNELPFLFSFAPAFPPRPLSRSPLRLNQSSTTNNQPSRSTATQTHLDPHSKKKSSALNFSNARITQQ